MKNYWKYELKAHTVPFDYFFCIFKELIIRRFCEQIKGDLQEMQIHKHQDIFLNYRFLAWRR